LKFILTKWKEFKEDDIIKCTKCEMKIDRTEIFGYYTCSIDDMHYHAKCAGDDEEEDSVYTDLTNEYEVSQDRSQNNSKEIKPKRSGGYWKD